MAQQPTRQQPARVASDRKLDARAREINSANQRYLDTHAALHPDRIERQIELQADADVGLQLQLTAINARFDAEDVASKAATTKWRQREVTLAEQRDQAETDRANGIVASHARLYRHPSDEINERRLEPEQQHELHATRAALPQRALPGDAEAFAEAALCAAEAQDELSTLAAARTAVRKRVALDDAVTTLAKRARTASSSSSSSSSAAAAAPLPPPTRPVEHYFSTDDESPEDESEDEKQACRVAKLASATRRKARAEKRAGLPKQE